MKKGIWDGCIDEGTTLEQKLAAAKRAGYDGVELTIGTAPSTPVHLAMSRHDVGMVRSTVERQGLEVASLMGSVVEQTPVLSADPDVRRRAVENVAGALERAAWFGVSTVLLHPGQLRPETPYDQAWEGTVEVLRALIPACERTGVGVGLENVWNKFLLSPREMRQILDEVGHPLIGCYLDTANMLLYGYAEHWVSIVGPLIRGVHVKDFKRGAGGGFCQLLDGDCNYPAVMRELRALGYDGYVTSEVSREERPAGQTIADTARRMDRIIAF
ncbi:MAG: hypothetical protein NVSMB65_04780 [Chloroflexota bacterium]